MEAQVQETVDRLRARAASVGMRVALDEARCSTNPEVLAAARKYVGWEHPDKIDDWCGAYLTADPIARLPDGTTTRPRISRWRWAA